MTYSVIRLEIIDLLLENNSPQVFTDKLYDVEIVVKAWPVSREATKFSVSKVPREIE